MKIGWKEAILFFSSILVMLVLLETFFRFFYFPYTSIYEPDEQLMYKLRGGIETTALYPELLQKVTTNDAGFVFQNPALEKPNSKKRVFLLGDSFAEGLYIQPEYHFRTILEQQMNGYEVLSYGVSSWGTANEYIYFKQNALTYRPDYLVLLFYYNDLENVANTVLLAFENGTIKELTPVTIPLPKRTLMNCASYLSTCNWLLTTYTAHAGALLGIAQILSASSVSAAPANSVDYDVDPYRNTTDLLNETWKNTELLFQDVKRITEKQNITFAIAYVPRKEEIQQQDFNSFVDSNNLTESDIDMSAVASRLQSIAAADNIIYINPRSQLQEAAKKEAVYSDRGLHFNKKGNEIFAEALEAAFNKP